MTFFRKRSVWVLLTVFIFSLFITANIAGYVLNNYKGNINTALGLTGTRIETVETDEDVDTEYFKSSFVQKDSNGDPIIVEDDNGYVHQLYDDEGLREATVAKAGEVQREGSVLLWNSDSNGLPLSKGNKVSVFSISSVAWSISGAGSGVSQSKPGSNVKSEFTEAGLEVNPTLWDFYSIGEAKSYKRENNLAMNEAPWSIYTSDVKNSFSSYSDAAIIVYTRVTREASNGGNGGDAPVTGATDTATGDYFDLSYEEEELLNEVVALKRAGTFSKLVILINTPTGMFMDSFMANKEYIDCCLWVGQTGYQGLAEVSKILVGDSIPTGRLPDLFPYKTSSAPASVNIEARYFSNADSFPFRKKTQQAAYLTYAEGIYVGYRYYETRYEDVVLEQGNAYCTAGVKNSTNNWTYKEEVAFPFGYGDTYTDFTLSNFLCETREDGDYDVSVTVKNTGDKVSKDVVQVYVQRPYTQYDIDNGIENAAVNLCGYAKTKYLEPNEEVNLTITVRNDAFKTYDANNKQTYIREKTEGSKAYYLTAAHDSHEAINNILAKKGYTPDNTSGRMDAEGNSSFVSRFDFIDDDFETFAVSDVTNNPITNQFNDVDWNKYIYKTESNITYLSRNNWRDTYPVSTVVLSLNQEIFDDLADEHPVVDDPNATMPLYGQPHQYSLIDLKGHAYDDPMWDVLLDQLTIDEQIKLLGTGYFGTGPIESITKPQDVAADGPLGLRKSFINNTSIRTMSYPSPTVMSATYNDQLMREVGELTGEDALHSGTNGLYSPGVNTHRSMYGARNWEYHSEDPFLGGMTAKWRVIGSQSKGCYVHMKHFALNDQESFRHGVGVWSNEQAIREIYLCQYEYAITEGHASGLMTAFVRFGTHWSGAHKGLCTNVVRNEWGMKGMILTDSAWQKYMGVIDGVLAGNDIVLYNVSLSMYDIAKTNPTVAQAVRRSVHNILYTTVNSNAMNGFSSNVRVYEVREWWQVLVRDVTVGLGIVATMFLLFTLVRFIFNKPLKKEKEFNRDLDVKASGDGKNAQKLIVHKNGVLISYLAINITILIVGLLAIPLSLESVRATNETNTSEAVPLIDKLEGEYQKYTLEAEDAFIDSEIDTITTDYNGGTSETTNNPSGTGFIANVNSEGSLALSFYFICDEEGQALLGSTFGRSDFDTTIKSMYTVTVNGKTARYKDLNHEIKATENSELKDYDWVETDMMIFNTKVGLNQIVFNKVESATSMLNFDNIYLLSTVDVYQETRDFNNYVFDLNDNKDPFIEEHKGSLDDSDSTYKTEGSEGLYRYGNLNGAKLTSTIIAEEKSMAVLYLLNDCRPDKTFSASNPIGGANPYIHKLKINNDSNVHLSKKSYPSNGWNQYGQSEIAFILLEEGENTISFEIGGDNINTIGLAISAPVPVKLYGQEEADPEIPSDDDKTLYVFNVNDANTPSNEMNEKNPFVSINGGSREDSDGSYATENYGLYRYGSGNNAKLTTTIVVPEACEVEFYLICDCRPLQSPGTAPSVFSYNQVAQTNGRANPYIKTLTLNDSVTNVTPSSKQYVSKGWNVFMKCEIATLSLNSGSNVIYFEIGGDNINYAGIAVNSPVEVTLGDEIITTAKYVFNTNNAIDPSNPENECNPFATINGGSVEDSNTDYKTEGSSGLYRYGNGKDAIVTVSLNIANDAEVTFSLINDCRPNNPTARTFSYYQVNSSYSTGNPDPYIEYLTVNDSTNGITPSTKQYVSQGWNVFMECELAKINLTRGTNIVKFKIAGDNINFCGITVTSPYEITLNSTAQEGGEHIYVFDTNNAVDPSNSENESNPFATVNGGGIEGSTWNYTQEFGEYRYGEGKGCTFTFTLNAQEASDVTLNFLGSSAGSRTFSFNEIVNDVTATVFISSMTLNGGSTGITPSNTVTSFSGWNTKLKIEVAELSLQAGENVISFVFTGNQGSSSKMNLMGVSVTSSSVITLGNN